MENRFCPYCGSENWEWMGNEYEPQEFHCHECDRWFGDDDVVRESIRHKISAILMDTNEDNQKGCKIILDTDDSFGLSSLGLPCIDRCYQEPCEGRIWFHFNGTGDDYVNFDEFETKALKFILDELNK